MVLITMSHLQFFILFLCLTSVLTSSINKSTYSSENSTDRAGPAHQTDSSVNSAAPLTYDSPILAPASSKKFSANHALNKSILAEGGPVPVPKSSSLEEIALGDNVNVSPQNFTHIPRENAPNERNAKSSVVPRKGVAPKIVPRKGAERMSDPLHSNMEELEPDKNLNPKVVEDITTLSTMGSFVSEEHKFPNNITDSNSTRTFSRFNSNGVSKTIQAGAVTPEVKWSNISSATQAPKKHRLKPTATIGESDEDKPIPASPTKTPPLGMPRKIDYIIPVVITIMSVPLLSLAAVVLYRRGRDCWDKRHYRRMDFLIDGMYNDWSSKGHAFPDSE